MKNETSIEKVNNEEMEISELEKGVSNIEERSGFKNKYTETIISGIMQKDSSISEKITSEHISKLIENSNAQDERDRNERKSDKNYQIIFLIIILFFIGFLVVFLKDDTELLTKIIITIISFGGGFGIGKIKQKILIIKMDVYIKFYTQVNQNTVILLQQYRKTTILNINFSHYL